MTEPSRRTVLWQHISEPSLERFELRPAHDHDGWRFTGLLLLAVDSEPACIRYSVALDSEWTTRCALVSLGVGIEPAVHSLRIAVDKERRWWIDRRTKIGRGESAGEQVPALHGLVDIDLGFTPATNTLPIRRLSLAIGQAADVTAAWVRFPELTVEPLSQRYIRLGERKYRYESRGGAFTAKLEVDDAGLVVRYEGGWERVAESLDFGVTRDRRAVQGT